MDWETIAEGTTEDGAPPDPGLESGAFYRLTLNLPFDVPDWAIGAIWTGLSVFGAVEISGSTIVITFQA